MNAIKEAIGRFLRGRGVSRFLESLGIDPKRYWLLMDLFEQLSDRGEMLSQLGRDGVALKTAAWLYFFLASLCGALLVAGRLPLAAYFSTFLVFTAFLLISVLLSETGNSLVNPAEGLVLAHQPINGATYTAAKLTHLLRILLYLVPGLNAVPALAGLFLKESRWWYPLAHMLAAFAVGVLAALLCCALFGWLIRFVPAPRLKTVGQTAELLPFLGFWLFQYRRDFYARFPVADWLPAQPALRWSLALVAGLAAAAIVVLGIRCLSGDYLIKISSIVHGGSSAKAKARRPRLGEAVARLFGGQPGRAGFEYLSRMMLRDWQFRRQMIPMVPALIGCAVLLVRGLRINPFSGRFTLMHLLPHVLGGLLFWICSQLACGSHYKGSWIFLLAPAGAFGRFARGVHALLWLKIVVIPHVAILVALAWLWGIADAALFVAYSVTAVSAYLALELRLIDGLPFGKQPEASRSLFIFPLIAAGALVTGTAVALQYFLIFRSPAIVAMTTGFVGVAGYFLTRSSLRAFEVSIRYNLGLLSAESGSLYKEVA